MSENNLSTMKAVCDAALALLRQDIGYNSGADSHVSDSITAKCDNVWNIARENLLQAHDWYGWGVSGSPSVQKTVPDPAYLRQLLVYSLARELAIPVTGRQEDLKTVDALYNSKLKVAIAKNLEEEMAALRASAQGSEDDKFVAEAIDLLKQYHSAADSDNGNGHPKPQPRSIAVLKANINSIKAQLVKELQSAHDWTYEYTQANAGNVANWRQELRTALLYRVVLAVGRSEPSFAMNPERSKELEKQYNASLKVAIAKDLESEMSALRASTDKDDMFAAQVLDVLRQYHSAPKEKDAAQTATMPQPRGIAQLVEHINSIKERIRYEVLTTHDWSFATDEDVHVHSRMTCDGKFSTPVPAGAEKIVKCYSDVCDKTETFVRRGDEIVTRLPIESVVYLFDDGGTDSWSETAKRAYLYRVALAVAYANPELFENARRIAQIEAFAESVMQDARTTDARQTHLGTSAYGRNYLYDVATGKRNAKWRGNRGRDVRW